jgi:hypothetical protein
MKCPVLVERYRAIMRRLDLFVSRNKEVPAASPEIKEFKGSDF